MRLVNIESPYEGNKDENAEHVKYARKCVKDCLNRGESPIASHLLYTQKDILDDNNPAERALGIKAGFAWNAKAEATIVYTDRGISDGMKKGVKNANDNKIPVEYRTLGRNGGHKTGTKK